MSPTIPLLLALLSLTPLQAQPAQSVVIHVHAARTLAPFQPAWSYFGYDEPNYTYAPHGKQLIAELASLSKTPVRIRTHHLLTTGDGTASLKFGSTNAYTEDAAGLPVYNWTIVDRILGTYLQAGAKPMIELGFMPKALSRNPDPYTPLFRSPADFKAYYLGWAQPPRDFAKWGELVYQLARHCAEQYGHAEAAGWDWEVWNEPNISYWKGSADEYNRLYDFAAAGVRRALPEARVGGPATTSPRDPKAAAFLRQFLDHCQNGKNAATGAIGSPLDFVSFHAKGSPDFVDGHVRMKLSNELKDAAEGFAVLTSFDKFRSLPVILSEADPEGCAACSAAENPANAYRNGPLYPTYVAAAIGGLYQLADRSHATLAGILTWAFEFEEKPYFAGYRDLATNGIDKPVLNVFRMAGLMHGDRVEASSDAAILLDDIVRASVRDRPLVDALATADGHSVSVLAWHYSDIDQPAPSADVQLSFDGLPAATTRVLLRHYRIDTDHSNAYTVWQGMGSPQSPTPAQYAQLQFAGGLQLLESPRWINVRSGRVTVSFPLPLPAVSLVQLSF